MYVCLFLDLRRGRGKGEGEGKGRAERSGAELKEAQAACERACVIGCSLSLPPGPVFLGVCDLGGGGKDCTYDFWSTYDSVIGF